MGLVAIQLAKRLGAHVFAVASGADGVHAALQLGADAAVNGREADVLAEAKSFAPGGFDAALALSSGPTVATAMEAVRRRGRLAYPHGIDPEPGSSDHVSTLAFDLTTAEPATAGKMMRRLNVLIEAGPFTVPISSTYPLSRAAEAHDALSRHRVGKIVLTPASSSSQIENRAGQVQPSDFS